MSTDGTQPPSIAPKKAPTRPNRPSTGTKTGQTRAVDPAARSTRPVTAPLSGSTPPSVGERIKRTGSGMVTEAPRPSSAAAADDVEESRTRLGTTGLSAGVAAAPVRDDVPVREPATTATSSSPTTGGARKVRLAVSKVDPWSVMKLSFLLAVAIGIMIVVASAVVWYTLDDLAVFTSLNDWIKEVTGKSDFFNVLEWASFKRVISLATMIAVVDVVILTALSTIGAFLYNIVSALVGGISVTLTDD